MHAEADSVSEGLLDGGRGVVPCERWPNLANPAFHGLAGDIVDTLAPQTESDPVAILGQLLAAVGSAAGRGPFFKVEGDRHGCNLFLCLVGRSSRGRKGTSFGRVKQLFGHADPAWCANCLASGLRSGEGLIWRVSEPANQLETASGEEGPGIDADRRLLVSESEFARWLSVMKSPGNTLSPVVRQAWDGDDLMTLSKNNPLRAVDPHVAVIAHVTMPELQRYLKETDIWNGFANRFLWLVVRRSKLLPDGGRDLPLAPLGTKLKEVLAFARDVGPMTRSEAAAHLWREIYPELTSESRTGLYEAATARAEAQVLRLSMIYALLDKSAVIQVEHLHAARAFWDYADASAKLIFDDPQDTVSDQVLARLEAAPEGLTRTQLHDAFGRNLSAAKLTRALAELQEAGFVVAERVRTGRPGAPCERWKAVRMNEETN